MGRSAACRRRSTPAGSVALLLRPRRAGHLLDRAPVDTRGRPSLRHKRRLASKPPSPYHPSMGGQRVLVGPGRGHRFELKSLPLLYRIRNRGSVALGRYEPRVTAFLAERLRSCSVFVDVGACTGYYTRVRSEERRVGKECRSRG